MPRALMLCYYYPPLIASGTTRSEEFVRHLPSFGWDPIVLTVEDAKDPWIKKSLTTPLEDNVTRTSEWNLGAICEFCQGVSSKLAKVVGKDLSVNYFREYFCLPDQQVAWQSTKEGTNLASKCEVIYASCSPFSSAISAWKIARATKKPFVLDFRDAWSLNPHVSHCSYHQNRIKKLERTVLEECAHLILNTDGALDLYRKQYPHLAQKMSAIPNGYDNLTPVEKSEANGPFKIMHVGSFYGARSPKNLLQAISELNLPVEFVQVGGTFEGEQQFSNNVKITTYPSLPRAKALELMQQASLLYLKQGWEIGVEHYIAVAAKTYEYLATGLPILAEVPPGDNAEIVKAYASASWLVEEDDVEPIKKALQEIYSQRQSIRPRIKESFIANFDRRALTSKLGLIFDSCK